MGRQRACKGDRSAGYVRWIVCALLFFAATINYVDRQVIGILKPTLQQQFGWSEIDYADIVFAFQLAYAIGLLLAGRFMDRVGTRLGFAIAIVMWSIAAMAHAEALAFGPRWRAARVVRPDLHASVAGFIAARFALGLGEAGNFPAAIKTVAEWFPKRERALATGIFNSGTNIGAVVAPLVVPFLTIRYGWYWAFIVTGALGFFWLVAWWLFYDAPERHRRVTRRRSIDSQRSAGARSCTFPGCSCCRIARRGRSRSRKFMTDPIWWLYLFWVPDFLNRNHGVNLSSVGLAAHHDLSHRRRRQHRRRVDVLVADQARMEHQRRAEDAPCSWPRWRCLPMFFAAQASSLWVAVALISLAAAAHQWWSCNVFTLASDMFPRQAVGSIVGFGGMAGAVGGMLIAKLTGALLEWTGSYVPVFIIAGSAYLVALLIVHLLAPRLEPARSRSEESAV